MKKLAIATVCTTLLVGSWVATESLARPLDNLRPRIAELGLGAGPGWKLANLVYELDLTDEQRQAIRTIIEAALPEARVYLEDLHANRQDLLAGTRGGNFDETFVRGIADAQGDLMAELIVLKEGVKAEIYPILTPAQQLILEQTLDGMFQ
jgi:Spy/CpxP family protein refolding chaperone